MSLINSITRTFVKRDVATVACEVAETSAKELAPTANAFMKKIVAVADRKVAKTSAEELASTTKVKKAESFLEKAERFLASSGDTLLGVRNNVAVVQNRAPYNKNLLMTSFYDNTTGKWLKTKYVTNGKLNYLPFGISSTGYHMPKGAQNAIQKLDISPEALSNFKTKSNCVTRFFDRLGLMEKTQIKARGTGRNPMERIVKQEVTNGQGKYTVLEPVSTPNNGSVSGYINETNGNIERSIRKMV